MPKVINFNAPDLRPRVDRLCERYGLSMGEMSRKLMEPQLRRLEREWERVERQVQGLDNQSTEDLEATENRLLDRLNSLSEAESHLLDEVQAELRRRSTADVPVAA